MKTIRLTQGFLAMVDDNFVPPGKYYALRKRNTMYTCRMVRHEGRRRVRYLHQDVLGLQLVNPPHVDHIDGDGLNNRKENLRIVTNAENLRALQKKSVGCSSRFRGVHWDSERQKWFALVKFNQKKYAVGRFGDEIEAAKARDKKALELFGPIAHLNFP